MPVTRSGKHSVAFGPSPSKNEDTVDLTMVTSSPGVKGRKDDGGNDENRATRTAEGKKVTTGALRHGIRDKTNFQQQSNDTKEHQQQHLDLTRNNGSSAKVDRLSQMCSTSNRNSGRPSVEGDQHDPIVGKRESRISQANALIDRAKEAHTQFKYDLSIQLYTEAVMLFDSGHNIPLTTDDKELLVKFSGKRATALMELGVYHAASAEYEKIAGIINSMLDLTSLNLNHQEVELSILLARCLDGQGCALLKMGKDIQAKDAYAQVIGVCDTVLEKALKVRFFKSCLNADYFKLCLQECKESALDGIKDVKCYRDSFLPSSQEDEQSVAFLDQALAIAPASLKAVVEKVKVLASLEQWTQVRYVCEALACETVRCSDLCLAGDLTQYDPFSRTSEKDPRLRADSLRSSTSTISSDGKYQVLGADEATEVLWRIPTNVHVMYVRSLHMEECFSEAKAIAKQSIELAETNEQTTVLSEELKFLDKITTEKSDGDRLFELNDYVRAAKSYSDCLKIENISHCSNATPLTDGIRGGKLHAILFCRRAACYFAMGRLEDAIKDCTAALGIRPNYLRARLRKARSLAKLGRLTEAMTDFWAWKSAIENGKTRPDSSTMTGSLGALHNISNKELQHVWGAMRKAMHNVITATAAAPPLPDTSSLVTKYRRMLQVGVPECAVRQKMLLEQAPREVLAIVFTSKKKKNYKTATPLSLSEQEQSFLDKPCPIMKMHSQNEAVEQKKELDQCSNRAEEEVLGSAKKKEPLVTETVTSAAAAPLSLSDEEHKPFGMDRLLKSGLSTNAAERRIQMDECSYRVEEALLGSAKKEESLVITTATTNTECRPPLSNEEQNLLATYRTMRKCGISKDAVEHHMKMKGCSNRVKEALFGSAEKEEPLVKGTALSASTTPPYLSDEEQKLVGEITCKHKKKKHNLKNLCWVPLSPNKASKCIWGEMNSTEYATESNSGAKSKGHLSKLEKYFRRKEVTTTNATQRRTLKEGGGTKKNCSNMAGLLDITRANNIAIGLRQFKDFSLEVLAFQVIGDVDPSKKVRQSEKVQFIKDLLPNAEEVTRIRQYEGSDDRLVPAELFFKHLLKINRVDAKVATLQIMGTFFEVAKDLFNQYTTLQQVCDAVLKSKKLGKVLREVLAIGNTMNQGAHNGGVVGFKFDSVLELTHTKSTDGKMTLLDYLVEEFAAESQRSVVEGLEEEVLGDKCHAASKFLLGYMKCEVHKLKKNLEDCHDELSKMKLDQEQEAATKSKKTKTPKKDSCFTGVTADPRSDFLASIRKAGHSFSQEQQQHTQRSKDTKSNKEGRSTTTATDAASSVPMKKISSADNDYNDHQTPKKDSCFTEVTADPRSDLLASIRKAGHSFSQEQQQHTQRSNGTNSNKEGRGTTAATDAASSIKPKKSQKKEIEYSPGVRGLVTFTQKAQIEYDKVEHQKAATLESCRKMAAHLGESGDEDEAATSILLVLSEFICALKQALKKYDDREATRLRKEARENKKQQQQHPQKKQEQGSSAAM